MGQNKMNIAVTGHRPQRLKGKEKEISAWIYEILLELQKEEAINAAYNGVAAGADQLFAMACIDLGIPLVNVFPYKRAHYHSQELYIMENGKNINYQTEYSRDSYAKRDFYMVDNCDVLIAVWDGQSGGGTYLTKEYARQQGKKIIYMPLDILLY